MSKNKKKQVSKTEKSLRNKIYYLKAKNKKILKEINSLTNENKKIVFEGRKILVKTYKNILKNKITQNNTAYQGAINHLKNKFNYDFRGIKNKPRSKYGTEKSPPYFAWETKDAKQWIDVKARNDPNIINYYLRVDEISHLMTSGNTFVMTYEKSKKKFDAFIIN